MRARCRYLPPSADLVRVSLALRRGLVHMHLPEYNPALCSSKRQQAVMHKCQAVYAFGERYQCFLVPMMFGVHVDHGLAQLCGKYVGRTDREAVRLRRALLKLRFHTV